MDIKLLAQTNEKQSYEDSNLVFYKEYALGFNLSDSEKDSLHAIYNMSEVYRFPFPVVTLRRRVDNIGGKLTPWDWEYLDCLNSQEKAVKSFGDSDYWTKCKSLDSAHAEAIAQSKKAEELRAELEKLENQIVPAKFQAESILLAEYQSRYNQELKDKKVYSKAQKGIANQDIINEIKQRISTEYKKELAQIESRIDQIKSELSGL